MALRVGGKKYAEIGIMSVVFFTIFWLSNIFLWDNQEIVKSFVQTVIATLIFASGMVFFQKKVK